MLTLNNLTKEYSGYKHLLTDNLNKAYPDIAGSIDLYGHDSEIDEVIDDFIGKCNRIIGQHEKVKSKKYKVTSIQDKVESEKSKVKSKKLGSGKPVKKELPKRKVTGSKLKKETTPQTKIKKATVKPRKDDNVKYVESIDIEVSLIKRFALLHQKTKTVAQLTALLTSLKKAILQKKIRANSIFAKEIKEIERRLIKLIGTVKQQKADEVKISIDDYERFKDIGNSEKIIKAVTYIIRYMGLINKPDIDKKAENLLKHINSALNKGEIDKKYLDTIKFIQANLSKPGDNKRLLEIPQTTLQGLNGLSGLDNLGQLSSILSGLANPGHEMVSAQQLARMDFDDIGLEPGFEDVLGRIAKSCAIMISGEPGSGKSSFALLFAKSRAEQGKHVLYITSEEGINSTMKEKIIRYKATLPNLIITTKIPGDKNPYDDIIFDSAQTLQLTPEDIRNNKNLNADLCFYVFQVTKGGVFRGAKDFEHEVDVVLQAKDGIVSSKGFKNRFGGNGQMKVY